MLNRRIATGMMSIVGALAIAGGATFAYFTDQETSIGNTISTAEFGISITSEPYAASNVLPGAEFPVTVDVKNDGSVPVNLRVAGLGSWGDPALDNAMVVSTVAEYSLDGGSTYVKFAENPSGFSEFVNVTVDDTTPTLLEVGPLSTVIIRVTMQLKPEAGNAYINKTYTVAGVVQAKQINASVWTETP